MMILQNLVFLNAQINTRRTLKMFNQEKCKQSLRYHYRLIKIKIYTKKSLIPLVIPLNVNTWIKFANSFLLVYLLSGDNLYDK